MPRGDGTGPMGLGPMTGRAAGYCAGYQVPGFMNPIPGRWFGMGFGRGRGFRGGGRGWRHWYYATGLPGWARAGYYGVPPVPPPIAAPTAEQEVVMLRSQAEQLQKVLTEIQKRIEELEAAEQKK